MPTNVQDLMYRIYNDTTVCISWGPPLHKNENVVYYAVSYTPDKNWPLESWFNFNFTTKGNSRVISFHSKLYAI